MKRLFSLLAVLLMVCLLVPHTGDATLVYRWSFDNDDLSYTGTGSGIPSTFGTIGYENGQAGFDRAATFSGGSTFWLVDTVNGLGVNYNAFSVSMHLKTLGAGWDDPFSIGDDEAGWRSQVFEITGGASPGILANYNIGNAGGQPGATTSTGDFIADDAWHHIGMTSDGTTIRIYFDGGETASAGFASTLGIEGLQVMSRLGDGARALAGSVDEVQVYDHVLSPAEMAVLAANPIAAIPEPSSLALLTAGALALVRRQRRFSRG